MKTNYYNNKKTPKFHRSFFVIQIKVGLMNYEIQQSKNPIF